MSVTDYRHLSDTAIKQKAREIKDGLITEAFGAWLAGHGGQKSFSDFTRKLGLEIVDSNTKVDKHSNIAAAWEIAARDRNRKPPK